MDSLVRSILPSVLWLFAFIFVVKVGLPLLFGYLRKRRLEASGIADIDQMDGKTFEQYLEALFERLGFQVERTRYVGDYGADLVVGKDGVKTIVQAKRWKKPVGVKAVQEAVAAKAMYGCTEAMVVTNSTYSKQAVELAKANKVVLWDRERLVDALLSVAKTGSPLTATSLRAPTATPSTMTATGDIAGATAGSASGPVRPVQATPREGVSIPTCFQCGKRVSAEVVQFCQSRPERFGEQVYCFDHQRAKRRMGGGG
jgi:restriction system protein